MPASAKLKPKQEATFTEGPWVYIGSTKHHGAYVLSPYGGEVCDCYTMSNLAAASVRNGGTSYPIPFQHERMDANARLIAAAPDLYMAVRLLMQDIKPAPMSPESVFDFARDALAKATGARS